MRTLTLSLLVFLLIACGNSINLEKVEKANELFVEMVVIMNAGGNNKDKIDESREQYKLMKEILSKEELEAHINFIKARRERLSQ